jgi:hypothetical protein
VARNRADTLRWPQRGGGRCLSTRQSDLGHVETAPRRRLRRRLHYRANWNAKCRARVSRVVRAEADSIFESSRVRRDPRNPSMSKILQLHRRDESRDFAATLRIAMDHLSASASSQATAIERTHRWGYIPVTKMTLPVKRNGIASTRHRPPRKLTLATRRHCQHANVTEGKIKTERVYPVGVS